MTQPARVSVFTPSHDTRYLAELYESLRQQTFADWEWVVLLNGRAQRWVPPVPDDRIRLSRAAPGVRGVGALKQAACALAAGEFLVEVDHDDLLLPDALAEVVAAFDAAPEAVLVYSDFAQITADGRADQTHFDEAMGWRYTAEQWEGELLHRCHAMASTPHNISYIWYAPNHVRAFRRTAYEQAGGYDPARDILDDQDLMIRLFALGDFVHVDRLLYLQRVHARNTQTDPRTNARIQQETVELYQQSIGGVAHAWAGRRGLRCLRVLPPVWFGPAGEEGFDDVVIDPQQPHLPVPDDSVGVILAPDLLQKVVDRAALFNEFYRVMADSALLLTVTPSTDGRGAFQDPSHVSMWNENSFMYLTQQGLRATLPSLQARFQVGQLRTHFPSPEHERLLISYVQADLIAVKGGPRNGGPLLC